MLDTLPAELCHQIAWNLPAPDVMACIQLNKSWSSLADMSSWWKELLRRDTDLSIVERVERESDTVLSFKQAFLAHAHARMLSSVKWYLLRNDSEMESPCSREGHIMCILGNRLIVTGGYCNDRRVHVLNLKPDIDTPRQWMSFSCRSDASYAYGASLTAIDDRRAVRFGGFRSGGYSYECNHVCLLTVDSDNNFAWQTIETSGSQPSPRAYHTATLIRNRYLLIIGGMESRRSMLSEAILDTETWTWLDVRVSEPMAVPCPAGRHGHSAVFDEIRNRVVIFGGGNGTDLLRSGFDNSEVWELQFDSGWEIDIGSSLPWKWRMIYRDQCHAHGDAKRCPLSPVQCLCLGRCHVGARVSRDSVVLCCGSGRPTTNGLLGYDLASDEFMIPTISGSLPIPRFTAASTAIGMEGWLLIHGGYSVQGGTLGDTILLDLAPGLKRDFEVLPQVSGFFAPHAAIRDADLDRARNRSENMHETLVQIFMATPRSQRQAVGSQIIGRLAGDTNSRSEMLIRRLVAGFARSESESVGDDDGDHDYEIFSSDDDDDDDDDESDDDGDEDGDDEDES